MIKDFRGFHHSQFLDKFKLDLQMLLFIILSQSGFCPLTLPSMSNTPSSVPPPFDPELTDPLSPYFDSESLAREVDSIEKAPRPSGGHLLSAYKEMMSLEEQGLSRRNRTVESPVQGTTIVDLQEEINEMVDGVIFSDLPFEEQEAILQSIEEAREELIERTREPDNDMLPKELSKENVDRLAVLPDKELKKELKKLKKQLSKDDLYELKMRIDDKQMDILRQAKDSGKVTFLIDERKEEGWEDPENPDA
jgi:hypothetical protein